MVGNQFVRPRGVEVSLVDDLECRAVLAHQHVGAEVHSVHGGMDRNTIPDHRGGDVAVERECRGDGGSRGLNDVTGVVDGDVYLEPFVREGVMAQDHVAVAGFEDDRAVVPTQDARSIEREEPDMRLARVEVEVPDHVGSAI